MEMTWILPRAALLVCAVVALGYLMVMLPSRFDYRVRDGRLHLRWRIFRVVPFWSWSIATERIRGLRPFRARDLLRNAIIFGRLPSRRGTIVELEDGRFRLVYVTPRDRTVLGASLPGSDFD
ncbi:MAG: hypothetical protein R3F20_17230 [Planctomycetota bacterium]